jgi:hypothetical protein
VPRAAWSLAHNEAQRNALTSLSVTEIRKAIEPDAILPRTRDQPVSSSTKSDGSFYCGGVLSPLGASFFRHAHD